MEIGAAQEAAEVKADGGAPGGRQPPGLAELCATFFVVGLTSFGLAILQNIRSLPLRKRWVSRAEIDEGLGLVQLYPGAMMVDLVAYIGYRARRVRGTLVAVAGFVTPALVLMLGLSWLYFRYDTQAGVRDLVVGLTAIVVAVVASVTVDFADEHARGGVEMLLAAAALAAGMIGVNVLWAVLGGLVIGVVALSGGETGTTALSSGERDTEFSWRRIALALLPGLLVAAGAAVAVLASGRLAALVADMAKIGTVAFGNGATILPVLRHDVVTTHHWLTPQQFAAGVGFGQATPGPILITAAFVGFRVAGWWGALLATAAIFATSIAMTTVAAEAYPYLRRLTRVRGAIRGVMAAFVGLLAAVTFELARQIADVPAALVLVAATLVALRRLKWSSLRVFGVGLAAWGLYLLAGGPT